jgi:predicted nucleotide-binding protein
MARPTSKNQKPQPPVFSAEQLTGRIQRIEQCIRDLKAFEPQAVQRRRGEPQVVALEAAIHDALAGAFGEGTDRYKRFSSAADLDQGPTTVPLGVGFGRGPRPDYAAQEAEKARRYLAEGKDRSISLLETAVNVLAEDYKELVADEQPIHIAPEPAQSNKVFIVHGHDKAVREGVARYLQKLGLDIIILDEQPNQGRTVIEKFEDCAREVGFAVVLLTPDDVASSKSVLDQTERARQNVIFELGYFAGKLGRGRACLLRKGEVEIPSDLLGVVYIDLDEKDGWRLQLVKELKAAKLQFSADRAFD